MGGKGSGRPKEDLPTYQCSQIRKTPSKGFSEDAQYIAQLVEIRKKADRNNIDTLYECLADYLMICNSSGRMITNESLYMTCGVSKDLITYWANGSVRKNDPRYKEFALFCRQICSVSVAEAMAMGRLHPAVGIFWGKAYQGLTDQPQPQTEYVPEETKDIESIKRKYANMIVEDTSKDDSK